jgi:hypothetical protein
MIVIIDPVTLRSPVPAVGWGHVVAVAVTTTYPGLEMLVVWGPVQPAGTRIVAREPDMKDLLFGAWKVKVKVFPVLPAVTLVGLTIMVPSPLLASPSVNLVCACDRVPVAVR